MRKGLWLWGLLGLWLLAGCHNEPEVARPEAIYIADTGNSRIVRIDDMTGKNWTAFGTIGNGEKQFDHPQSVWLDSGGRIYVADTGNNRIVRIDDMTGKGWAAFGRKGDGASQFTAPSSVFVDHANRLYIADRYNDRIVRCDDMGGANWKTLGAQGDRPGQFSQPACIYVDPADHIYVADTLNIPQSLANNRIVRMNDMTGSDWTVCDTADDKGGFAGPQGLYVDPTRHLYIADTLNHRIVRVDTIAGKAALALGTQGGATLQFNQPTGIFVDASDRIFVADSVNDRIVRIDDMTGKNWTTFLGSGPNHLSSPMGVYIWQPRPPVQ